MDYINRRLRINTPKPNINRSVCFNFKKQTVQHTNLLNFRNLQLMAPDSFLYISRLLFLCSLPVAMVFLLMTYLFKRKYGGIKWVAVPAVVISSKTKEVWRPKSGLQFEPEVSCQYEFRGNLYKEVVPCPDPGWSSAASKSYAEDWTSLFSEGMQLTVYVDPNEPAKVVFFPHFTSNWAYGIANAFAVIGLLAAVIPQFLWLIIGE